jgi:hypothetical protein
VNIGFGGLTDSINFANYRVNNDVFTDYLLRANVKFAESEYDFYSAIKKKLVRTIQ